MNAEEHALTVAAAFPWSPKRAWLSVQACRFSDITVAALSIPPKNLTNRLAKRRPNPAMLSEASKTPRGRDQRHPNVKTGRILSGEQTEFHHAHAKEHHGENVHVHVNRSAVGVVNLLGAKQKELEITA